jgi:hypothetical protein
MSARPGRIKLDRGVDIPHPRRDSVKTTPVFMELKAERTAMSQPPEGRRPQAGPHKEAPTERPPQGGAREGDCEAVH